MTGKSVRRYQFKILYMVRLWAYGILLVIPYTLSFESHSLVASMKLKNWSLQITVSPLFLYGCETWCYSEKRTILKALNYIVLKRIFINTESIKGWWITIHIRYWLFAIFSVITSMMRTSRKCEKVITHTKFWSGNIKERDHLANFGVQGRIEVVKKQDVKDWIGSKSSAVVHFCDCTNWTLGSITARSGIMICAIVTLFKEEPAVWS